MTDHEPGKVSWPSDMALMDGWVQAALDDPRPGDVFHEMYSVGVEVVAIDHDWIGWRRFDVQERERGWETREKWKEAFRYKAPGLEGRHTMQLLERGAP